MSNVTIKFGPANSFTADASKYNSVADILNDSSLQSLLGFGDNVEAFVGGIRVDGDYVPVAGDVVSIQTRAHEKGADGVTIKFGPANSFTADASKYDDIDDILDDSSLQSLLGFGDNVEAFVGGIRVDGDYVPVAGDVVSIQTKAHEKGNK